MSISQKGFWHGSSTGGRRAVSTRGGRGVNLGAEWLLSCGRGKVRFGSLRGKKQSSGGQERKSESLEVNVQIWK